MSTDNQPGLKNWLPLHPVTEALLRAIRENVWPGPAAAEVFGLTTAEHAEALYAAVRSGEVTPEALDDALGDGPAITRLVANASANPNRSIAFKTGLEEEVAELKNRKSRRKGGGREPGQLR